MNQTLQNISCDTIRQNLHNDITNSPFYDIVWNDWENKYTEFTKNVFYPILHLWTLKTPILQGKKNVKKRKINSCAFPPMWS